MKLLFDQNISFRIEKKIQSVFPESKQLKNLGLENYSDIKIWNYAKLNDFVIVTFDADFADIANIKGCPPKIIWLRTGNMTTNHISELLIKHRTIIHEFIVNTEYSKIACLEIQ